MARCEAVAPEPWTLFAGEIADVLTDLSVGELIRFEAWDVCDDEPELVTHAYFIRHARHRIRVAVAAGTGVPQGRGHRLSVRQEARLVSAGWTPPSRFAGPDFYRDADFPEVETLAELLVSAFRDIWGLPHPNVLTIVGCDIDRGMSEPPASVVTEVRRVT